MDARGVVDLDRGTLAFFTRVDKEPVISEWEQLGGVSGRRNEGTGAWSWDSTGGSRIFCSIFMTLAATLHRSNSSPASDAGNQVNGITWPLDKYGASIRGQHLDIHLASKPSYDRVRVFLQRRFKGEFMRLTADGREQSILPFDAPHAGIWHRRLSAPLADEHLILKRKTGNLGQIDFYRAEPMKDKPKKLVSYAFNKVEKFSETELGKALACETPTRFHQPVLATQPASAS